MYVKTFLSFQKTILRVDFPTFPYSLIYLGNEEMAHSSPFLVKCCLCNIKCKFILHFQVVLLLPPLSPDRGHHLLSHIFLQLLEQRSFLLIFFDLSISYGRNSCDEKRGDG